MKKLYTQEYVDQEVLRRLAQIRNQIAEYDLNNISGYGSGSGSMMKNIVLSYLDSIRIGTKII